MTHSAESVTLTHGEKSQMLQGLQELMIPAYVGRDEEIQRYPDYCRLMLELFHDLYAAFYGDVAGASYVSNEYCYFVPMVSQEVRTSNAEISRVSEPRRTGITANTRDRIMNLIRVEIPAVAPKVNEAAMTLETQ